ncbi:2Fe-2S iron-sulfur cluster-binding protein [Pseudorhodoplanes sp.]|uniref:2Fe-2S iron-sulfur cluster-binding protein n=1 Tax=Pseudorhodoplanes sp. TaxID=1934341 RepID=UPI003D1100EF
MPAVTFTYPDGTQKVVDIPKGQSVMKGALANGIKGIVAECGGTAMCGTCHVYVDECYLDKLPPVSVDENAMLDATSSPREPNSRLSCQIAMSDALAGLRVRIPESQT